MLEERSANWLSGSRTIFPYIYLVTLKALIIFEPIPSIKHILFHVYQEGSLN